MTDEGLVSFECKVIGYPTPQLSWFKDGKQLQPGDVYELTGSKSLGISHEFDIIISIINRMQDTKECVELFAV